MVLSLFKSKMKQRLFFKMGLKIMAYICPACGHEQTRSGTCDFCGSEVVPK